MSADKHPTEASEAVCASCQSTNLAVNPTEGVYRCANCGFTGELSPAAGEVQGTQVGSQPGEALTSNQQLDELGEAARRAGTIVTEYIDSIVASAELRAEEIRQAGQRDREAGERAREAGEQDKQLSERDAEQVRRDAFESASRVFDRIQALERPLGELVHTLRVELDRVGMELEGGSYQPAISAEAESARLSFEEPAVEEIQDAEEVHDVQEVPDVEEVHEAEAVQEQAPAAEAPEEAETPSEPVEPKMFIPGRGRDTPPPPKEKKPKRRIFGRKDPSPKGVFITTEGHCAVCQKTFMAGSEEEFERSGWRANGDIGLCPDCQADSWQLPDGARLPFRRGGV